MSRIFRQLGSKSFYIKAGAREFSSNGGPVSLKRLSLSNSTQSLLKPPTNLLALPAIESSTCVFLDKRYFSLHKTPVHPSYQLGWSDHDRRIVAPPTVISSCNYNPLLLSDSPMIFQQLRFIRTQHPRKLNSVPHSKSSSSQTHGSVHHHKSKAARRADTSVPTKEQPAGDDNKSMEPEDPAQLTLYQRFKKTYKEHGKVLVIVHLITSTVWFGSFYTAARLGIDIVPLLENMGLSEKLITPFRKGGLGDVALAYLMYKLATPARYTVTIGGTNLAIRYLRKEGRMAPMKEENKLRSLYNEGKEDFKERSRRRISRIRKRRVRSKQK